MLTVLLKPNKNLSEHETCAAGSSGDKQYLFCLRECLSTTKNIVKQTPSSTINFDNIFFQRCSDSLSDDKIIAFANII